MSNVILRLSFIGFITALATRSVDPIVPAIAQGLNTDPARIALLSTAFALPFAVIQPLLGPIADMVGKVKLMVICLVIVVVASLVGGIATDYSVLLGSRIVAGMATGGVFPVGLALIGDLVPVQQRQVAIGRWLTVIMTGNILGASVAGVVNDLFGWRAVFLVIAGIGAIVFLSTIGLGRKIPQQRMPFDLRTVPASYRAIFANPRAKVCYSAVLVEGIAIFGMFPFVALLLLAAGEARASIAGLVLGGFSLGALIYALTVQILVNRVRPERQMQAGGVICALAFCVVALELAWPIQFAAFLFAGYAFFMIHGQIQVQATELSQTARGAAMSLHSMFFFIGQAVGPVLFGIGLATIGASPSVLMSGATMLALGLACAALFRRLPSKPD
ncbi:MAG: MFS transporter [Pseudorhodoplanes sp.]|nr:MFS transporter [Pseudorhodoplanes sp.]